MTDANMVSASSTGRSKQSLYTQSQEAMKQLALNRCITTGADEPCLGQQSASLGGNNAMTAAVPAECC